MQKNISVSVVLPAYNEEANIRRTIGSCIEACGNLFSEFEIIVVDDGSADNTAEIVKETGAVNKSVKLIKHPGNLGYGAALRTGFKASGLDWIFFMDSDGQFNPMEISAMVPYLGDNDIVAGYRINRSDNAYRRFLGWTFSRLMNLFFGTGLRDIDCAFKFLRGNLLRELPLTSEASLINTEILYHARRGKWRVKEIGVHHFPRVAGEQSGGSLRVIFKSMRENLRLFVRLRLL